MTANIYIYILFPVALTVMGIIFKRVGATSETEPVLIVSL